MMDACNIHVFLSIVLKSALFFKYIIRRLLESLFRSIAFRFPSKEVEFIKRLSTAV